MQVPDGWKNVRLSTLSKNRISNGAFNDPKKVGSGYRLINVVNLYTPRHIDVDRLNLLELTDKEFKNFQVENCDLFFTRSSLKLEGIAHCNIFDGDEDNVVYECHIMRMRPLRTKVIPKYLLEYCQSHPARKHFMSCAKTGTMTTIDQEGVGSLNVPLPPLPEQRKISQILSTWDKAIEKLEALIDAKQKRKKALMQRLLTGKMRFTEHVTSLEVQKTKYGSLPSEWKYLHIGDVAKQISLKNNRTLDLPVLSCTKHYGLVDSLAYFGKRIYSEDTSTYKIVPKNAFAYATNHIEEGSIGYQSLYEEALISPMYTVFQTNNNINDEFLYSLLKTELYRHIFEANTSASVDRRGSLRWNEFAQLKIPVPSLPEQQKIADIFSATDKEIITYQNQLAALKQQKTGLMQQLLTGKKRVSIGEVK